MAMTWNGCATGSCANAAGELSSLKIIRGRLTEQGEDPDEAATQDQRVPLARRAMWSAGAAIRRPAPGSTLRRPTSSAPSTTRRSPTPHAGSRQGGGPSRGAGRRRTPAGGPLPAAPPRPGSAVQGRDRPPAAGLTAGARGSGRDGGRRTREPRVGRTRSGRGSERPATSGPPGPSARPEAGCALPPGPLPGATAASPPAAVGRWDRPASPLPPGHRDLQSRPGAGQRVGAAPPPWPPNSSRITV